MVVLLADSLHFNEKIPVPTKAWYLGSIGTFFVTRHRLSVPDLAEISRSEFWGVAQAVNYPY
jgi:hypothetical protein